MYRSEFVWQDKHKLSTGFSGCGNCNDHSACRVYETYSAACQNYLSLYPGDNFNMLSGKMLTRNPRGISPLDLNGI